MVPCCKTIVQNYNQNTDIGKANVQNSFFTMRIFHFAPPPCSPINISLIRHDYIFFIFIIVSFQACYMGAIIRYLTFRNFFFPQHKTLDIHPKWYVSLVCSFLPPSNIPLYRRSTIYLTTYLLEEIWAFSKFFIIKNKTILDICVQVFM